MESLFYLFVHQQLKNFLCEIISHALDFFTCFLSFLLFFSLSIKLEQMERVALNSFKTFLETIYCNWIWFFFFCNFIKITGLFDILILMILWFNCPCNKSKSRDTKEMPQWQNKVLLSHKSRVKDWMTCNENTDTLYLKLVEEIEDKLEQKCQLPTNKNTGLYVFKAQTSLTFVRMLYTEEQQCVCFGKFSAIMVLPSSQQSKYYLLVLNISNVEKGAICYTKIQSTDRLVCLFVLRFYGPVNPMGSCRARSVYLTTRLLGRLSPLSG